MQDKPPHADRHQIAGAEHTRRQTATPVRDVGRAIGPRVSKGDPDREDLGCTSLSWYPQRAQAIVVPRYIVAGIVFPDPALNWKGIHSDVCIVDRQVISRTPTLAELRYRMGRCERHRALVAIGFSDGCCSLTETLSLPERLGCLCSCIRARNADIAQVAIGQHDELPAFVVRGASILRSWTGCSAGAARSVRMAVAGIELGWLA
jgi:hypothetical protein